MDDPRQKVTFSCGEIFPIHGGDEHGEIDKYEVEIDGGTTPDIESVHSFHADQIPRSVDQIDGLNPSSSESEDGKESSIDQQVDGGNEARASRRVTFLMGNPISSIHVLERPNAEDKAKMFYTSKDLTGFRIEYILELQELQEKMESQKTSGSRLLNTLAAKFSEIVSCKSIIDFFCADPNRASI